MTYYSISVGIIILCLACLVKGDGASYHHRDAIAANLKRFAHHPRHDRRLEDPLLSEACLEALTAQAEDPIISDLILEYDAAYGAFVNATDFDTCEEGDQLLKCTFEWEFPKQNEFNQACVASGGVLESYESDLKCQDASCVTVILDYPGGQFCVPLACGDEISTLTDVLNDVADEYWESTFGTECAVGDINDFVGVDVGSATCDNVDPVGGNGDSTGGLGDSTGDTGDTTGDTGDSTGDVGDSTGDTGDSVGETGDSTSDGGDGSSASDNSASELGDSSCASWQPSMVVIALVVGAGAQAMTMMM